MLTLAFWALIFYIAGMKNIFIYLSTILTLIGVFSLPGFAVEKEEEGAKLPPLVFSAINAGYKDPSGN